MSKRLLFVAFLCGLALTPMAQAKKTDTEAGRAQLVKQFHAKNTKVFSIFVKGFC